MHHKAFDGLALPAFAHSTSQTLYIYIYIYLLTYLLSWIHGWSPSKEGRNGEEREGMANGIEGDEGKRGEEKEGKEERVGHGLEGRTPRFHRQIAATPLKAACTVAYLSRERAKDHDVSWVAG